MTVYVCVYDGGRQVWEITDPENLRELNKSEICHYKPGAGYYGPIYQKDSIFTIEAAARAFWTRQDAINYKPYLWAGWQKRGGRQC